MPEGAFFILPLLYSLGALAVVVVAVVSLWRIMKAQEQTARALQQIARALSHMGPPA